MNWETNVSGFFFLIFIFFLWSQSWLNVLSRHSMGTHQGNELTCNSSGNSCLQSSQFTEPLWTDPQPERVKLVEFACSPLWHVLELCILPNWLTYSSCLMSSQLWWSHEGQTQAIILQAKVPFTFHVSCHVTVEEDWETNEAEWTNWEGRNKKGSTLGNWWNLSCYIQTYSRLRNKIFDSTRDLEKM